MIDFVKLASKWRSTREPLSFDSEGIFRVKKTKKNHSTKIDCKYINMMLSLFGQLSVGKRPLKLKQQRPRNTVGF